MKLFCMWSARGKQLKFDVSAMYMLFLKKIIALKSYSWSCGPYLFKFRHIHDLISWKYHVCMHACVLIASIHARCKNEEESDVCILEF